MHLPSTHSETLTQRRAALLERFAGPALLFSGLPVSRNFRANVYPFRANSHFLFFAGRSMAASALLFRDGKTVLYTAGPDPDDALWHGPRPTLAAWRDALAVDEVLPIDSLAKDLEPLRSELATLPTEDALSSAELSRLLGRQVAASSGDALEHAGDAHLADTLVDLRLRHDAAAIEQLSYAAEISAKAHLAGMAASRPGRSEHHVVAAMLGVLRQHGLEDAYGPIVTVRGEVLHAHGHGNALSDGDLLLADVGGETPEGWAADITRTWPVNGRFSSSQRVIYDLVLAAQEACIAACRPGVRYRHVHQVAKRSLVAGLVDLGIFRGAVDGLLERGAAAVFFPHGIGHLLGLDVHDMEDLGDRAGYATGRQRSQAFGDAFLRLDRDLEAGMLVTIEPGFYQVPGILNDPTYTEALGADFNREALAAYQDVRGIRIEDDVLITAEGCRVLSAGVPKSAAAVEEAVRG